MNCPNCGNPEMKHIPAGTSKKTGKPYGAFYKCEECGKTANGGEQPRVIKQEETNWDAIGMAKAASQLYSACYQHGDDAVVAAEKVRYALNDIALIQQNGYESEKPF